MDRRTLKYFYLPALLLCCLIAGCGYTTHSLLPSDFKVIKVENFKSNINVAAEQSNVRMYRGYRPGMEVDLTKTIINKFLLDGTLKITSGSNADMILRGDLIDFKRDAIRYDTVNNDVLEYRIKLIVDMQLIKTKTGEVVWRERGFAGETTYRTTGALTKTEAAAVKDAIDDLARRIVERTVEAW